DIQSLLQRVQTLEGSLSACIAAEESSAISNRESTASRCDEESDPSHNSDSPPVHKQRSDSEIASQAKSRQRELSQYTCRWGPNWYFNGIAMSSEAGLEWISQRTGQPVSPADFSIPIEELSAGLPGDSLPLTALCELPDKTVVLDVLKAYIESSFRLAYPVFDEIMFKRQVEKAYEPQKGPHYSTAQVSANLCVFSMLALKSHLNAPRICLPEDEDIYAAKAHYLLESIKSDGTYPTLEAAIVLQILSMLRGHWHGASSYGLIAFLIIRELGGTRDLRPIIVGMPDIEAFRNWQHMQLLFWISFIIDKNVALFTGRPPYLAEIYCDLAVPVNYLPWEEFQSCAHIIDRETGTLKALPPKPSQFFRAHLPGDLEISPLKEEVYKRLFSRAANRAKNNQLLQHIREIDELIEDWRLSFREEYRPVLSVSDETLPNEAGGDVPIMIRRTALQLEYLHLMTVTHTTVRKCKDATSENSPNLHSVVHSSFDISLEASRSIIRCLKFLIDRVGQGAFQ
ncbi:hypothetical protein N7539_005099, partial [Penicillium diatomitis]